MISMKYICRNMMIIVMILTNALVCNSFIHHHHHHHHQQHHHQHLPLISMLDSFLLSSSSSSTTSSSFLSPSPSSSSSPSSSLPSRFSSLSYVDVNASRLLQTERLLLNEFNRFLFLRDFLDVNPVYDDDDYNDDYKNMNFPIKPYIRIDDNIDIPTHTPRQPYKLESCNDVNWTDMEPVLALVLGFRVDRKDIKIVNNINKNTYNINVIQDISLTPKGWEDLPGVPDLSRSWSKEFTDFILSELPGDDEASDLAIETIIGNEIYKHMKKSSNDDIQKRILLSKWLYSQDFLTSHYFPIRHKNVD